MTLSHATPTKLRLVLAACAGHPQTPLSVEQKALVLSKLIDQRWQPTAETLPVPLGLIQGWYDAIHATTSGR
jgi:hypothetical protein